MSDKKIYVMLDSSIKQRHYFYCITDQTVYEYDEDYSLYRKPLLIFALFILVTVLILAIWDWGISGSRNPVHIGIALLLDLSILAIPIIGVLNKRRGKTYLHKSEKTLSSFRIDLPLIKWSYLEEMLILVLGLLVTAFTVWLFDPIIYGMVVLLYFTIVYAFVFHGGIFHKKKVIKLLERDESGYGAFH